MKIKYRILFVMLGFVVFSSGVFSYQSYVKQHQTLIKGIDEKLYTAAVMARAALPADYHDRITDAGSVPKEEFDRTVERFNRLCDALGLEYLWSLMKIDGKIVFTSATSPDKDVAGQKHAKFFEEHSSPELYEKVFSSMEPQYQVNRDKWGQIMTALVPFQDSHGRAYMFGASMTLAEVDRLLEKNFRELVLLSSGFILAGFVFSYLMAGFLSDPFQRLIQEISRTAKGELDGDLTEAGSYEEAVLARSFNHMRIAIKDNISALTRSMKELELFQGAVEASMDAIGMSTAEGWHYYQNQAFDRLFGDIGQDPPVTLYANEDEGREVFKTIMDGGQWAGEIQMRGTGGRILDIFLRAYAVKDEEGRILGLVGVHTDITQRKLVELKLRESEDKFRTLFESMVEGVALHELVYDSKGQPVDYRVINVNPAYEKHTGLLAEQVIGKTSVEAYGTPEPPYLKIFSGVALTMEPYAFETYFPPIERHFMISAVSPKSGQFATIFEDITERKKQEMALVNALRQKETLLREIHHRVKNNVLFLQGLITLQQGSLNESHDANEILETVRQRIQSVGLAHQLLYQSEDLSSINFSEYIRNIVSEIFKIYKGGENEIDISFDLQDILLNIDRAVPCGLILSELVVNAFKHAFAGRARGNIFISFKRAGRINELVVRDDGIGVKDGVFSGGATLGLKLVENLARQIKGVFEYRYDNGAVFSLRFKDEGEPGP